MCFCARVNITTCVCVCECKYARESGRACSADRYRCSHVRVPISNDCKSGTLGQYYYSCTNKHTHTSAQRIKRIHGTSDTYARTRTHTRTHTDANLSHTFRIAWSFFPRGCSVHIHVSRTTEAEAETGTTLRHNAFALTHTYMHALIHLYHVHSYLISKELNLFLGFSYELIQFCACFSHAVTTFIHHRSTPLPTHSQDIRLYT